MNPKPNPFRTLVQREDPGTEKPRSQSPPPQTPKRGRPATGKRSNEEWVTRTFYLRRETDLDLEERLLEFKRHSREMDKSELIDRLLDGWVRWHKGENIELCLSDISPIRKSD